MIYSNIHTNALCDQWQWEKDEKAENLALLLPELSVAERLVKFSAM